MMTKEYLPMLIAITAILFMNPYVNAEPMDAVAAEKLPQLKSLVQSIGAGNALTSADVGNLRECLQSCDPVLVSIASWCVMKLGSQGDVLQSELSKVPEKIGDMPSAFVILAKTEYSSRKLGLIKRKEKMERLAASENPYLKVEAAKRLLQIDKAAGRKLLINLAEAPNKPIVASEALRELRRLDQTTGRNTEAPVPQADEKYMTVLSVIE